MHGGCVEAGEQLVHHDEQPHCRRLLGEQRLGRVLVGLRLGHAGLCVNLFQQFGVGVVDELLVGFGVRAGFLQRHIPGLRVVGSHHGALALERRILEQREVLAGLVDAGGHENGVAALAGKTRFDAEVEDDVVHHAIHARLGAEHFLHRAPSLFQLVLLPVVQPPGLGLEPGVDLVVRAKVLVDVPRLIDQVEHYLVLDALAELVGVDVAAEHFQTGPRVLLEQRRTGETDKNGIRHHRLHHAMQLAALGTVALVHEYKHLTNGRAGLSFQFFDIGIEIIDVLVAKLVHQRAQQARCGLTELGHQVAAAGASGDADIHTQEYAFDLLIQRVAVSDDGNAGVWVVLQNPLRKQHHHDALAAALRMPDDSALLLAHLRLRRLDAEILVRPRQLLHSAIEEHKVVHQLDQPVLSAHLEQVLVELEAAVVVFVLLPIEKELFRRADGAVPEALGIVAGKNELHRAEEPGVELRLLIGEILTDTVADAHAAVLQLQNADGDAIHIQHDVRPPLMVPLERHLLGNGEIVLLGLPPVDEVDGFRHLARLGLYGYAVAQQVVDSPVVTVERAAVVVGFGAEFVESRVDLRWRVTALGQPCREQVLLDIAVVAAVSPVAQIVGSPVRRGTGR